MINEYYEISNKLGEGAYGEVYKVVHKQTQIVRAMKKLKKTNLIKEDEGTFFSEIDILKTLDHPNIIKVYELFEDELDYYLVTEFCHGGEMLNKIQSLQKFTEKMAATYMRQILSAVVYCHQKNVVHRDIKPENILLSSSNQNDNTIKLIDFGTSRIFDPTKKMKAVFGTPYYMAPEVIISTYNEKCDIWSVGVIMYIMLCGYPPFRGNNQNQIIKKIQEGKVEFPGIITLYFKLFMKILIKKRIEIKFLLKQRHQFPKCLHLFLTEGSLHRMLQVMNEQQRIQKMILWIKKYFFIQKALMLNFISSLIKLKLQSKNKFKTAIEIFIATNILTNQETDELTKAFKNIDFNGDGTITKEELIKGKLFESFLCFLIKGYFQFKGNYQLSLNEAEELINQIDYNQSGKIDYSEFVVATVTKEKFLQTSKIDQAFQLFDKDNNGYIEQNEFQEIMGEIINEEKWQTILCEYDTNNDGKLSKDEFILLLKENISSLIQIKECCH